MRQKADLLELELGGGGEGGGGGAAHVLLAGKTTIDTLPSPQRNIDNMSQHKCYVCRNLYDCFIGEISRIPHCIVYICFHQLLLYICPLYCHL